MMANASCRKGRRLEKVEISTAVRYRETIPSIEGNTERQFASRFRQLTRTACNCAIALVTAQHESAKCRPHDQPRVMRKAIAPEEGDREHDEIEVEHAWHSEQACEPWCGGPQFKCNSAGARWIAQARAGASACSKALPEAVLPEMSHFAAEF
jgi:hypothetical protein